MAENSESAWHPKHRFQDYFDQQYGPDDSPEMGDAGIDLRGAFPDEEKGDKRAHSKRPGQAERSVQMAVYTTFVLIVAGLYMTMNRQEVEREVAPWKTANRRLMDEKEIMRQRLQTSELNEQELIKERARLQSRVNDLLLFIRESKIQADRVNEVTLDPFQREAIRRSLEARLVDPSAEDPMSTKED